MSTIPVKPFLIAKDEQGEVRLTVRETRYNSQGYPWVTPRLIEERFKTAASLVPRRTLSSTSVPRLVNSRPSSDRLLQRVP